MEIKVNYFLQINSIVVLEMDIELNLYSSLTACAMCHQLTPTDTMISTKVGNICIKCDIKMTRAGNMLKSNKTTKDSKNK
jgi:hypothetical protein